MTKLKEYYRFLGIEVLVLILVALFSLRSYLTQTIGTTALSNNQFYLFVLAIFCITIGANILTYFNSESSKKPIAENQLYYAFFTLNLIGLAAAIYLANAIDKSSFATLFGMLIFLIHSYGSKLQFNPIYKVVIPALLISLSIVLLLVFDVLPLGKGINEISNGFYFFIGVKLSIFVFILLIINNLKNNIDKTYSENIAQKSNTISYWVLNILSLLVILFLAQKSIAIGLENKSTFYVILLGLLMPILAFYIFYVIQKNSSNYLVYLLKISLLAAALHPILFSYI